MAVRRVRLDAKNVVVLGAKGRILDGACIELEEGVIVTLQGGSGSGKTTLLRVLGGLVEPSEGEIRLDGSNARSIAPSAYRRRVAFVLQNPPMLEGTVGDNVKTGPRLHGDDMTDARVDSVLSRVGLAGFRERDARKLSGGEKQRVALARALSNDPHVLLLDEPTSALDPSSAEHVLGVVRALARSGLAIALVTHTEAHAVALGGRRLVVTAGRVQDVGETP